jgi:hypothetical protein
MPGLQMKGMQLNTGDLNVAEFRSIEIPDDLKSLAKDVMDSYEDNKTAMTLPLIEVAKLIDRISRLETDANERELDSQEEERLRTRLAQLLTGTANALHNGPMENGLWSWHDLPELAAEAMDKINRLEKANENLSFNR